MSEHDRQDPTTGEPVRVRPGEATDSPSVLVTDEGEVGAPIREGGTIPIVEERLRVDKRVVDKGTVRVSTRIETVDETVETDVASQTAEVERVRVDRVVDAVPEPQLDGDTVVIPIVEERLVVVKQLVVAEEVRVKLDEFVTTDRQTMPVRKERVTIDRIPPRKSANPADEPTAATGREDDPAHPTD